MQTVQSPQKSFLVEIPIHKIPQARAKLIERMAKDLIEHSVMEDRDDAIRLLLWKGYARTDVHLLVGEVIHWAQITVLMKAMA